MISRLSSGRNIFFYFVFDFSLDTTIVAKTLTQNFSDGLKSLITTTAGLTMMTWISVKLTSVMMLILPPIVIGSVSIIVFLVFINF